MGILRKAIRANTGQSTPADESWVIQDVSIGSDWSDDNVFGGDNWTTNLYENLVFEATGSNLVDQFPDIKIRPGAHIPSSYAVSWDATDFPELGTHLYFIVDVYHE